VVALASGVGIAAYYRAENKLRIAEAKKQKEQAFIEIAQKTSAIAFAQMRSGDWPQAEADLRAALQRATFELSADNPITLRLMHNLAGALQGQKELSRAEEVFRQALAGRRRALGEDARDTLITMNTLGALLRDAGKYDEADQLLTQALEIRRKTFGSGDSDTVQSMYDLAVLRRLSKKYPEAAALLRDVVRGRLLALGPDHPATIGSTYYLAMTLRESGMLAEAEPLYRGLYERSDFGKIEQGVVAIYKSGLSVCLAQAGKNREAEPLLREAYERLRLAGENRAKATREVAAALAAIYEQAARHDDAAMWRAKLEALEAATQPTRSHQTETPTSSPHPATTRQ
jgi:tetratricopeptide (TPR) repeat protein